MDKMAERFLQRMSIVFKEKIVIFFMLSFPAICSGENEQLPLLRNLKSLPKVHYSFPLPGELLNDSNNRLLYETARIMNSVSISGEWASMVQVRNAVYTCARINKTKPHIAATIGINYSPYHRELDPNVSPIYRGPTYKKELDRFKNRLTSIKDWIKGYNQQYQNDVKVGAVLLDTERYFARPSDEQWNEGMRVALDDIHLLARGIFPDARIEWYDRGIGYLDSASSPWRKTPLFTGKEILPSPSCSLYYVPEIERTLELYRRTAKLADELGVEDVTPWVALASGYRRGIEKAFRFDNDWDYDLIYSYQMGAELNRHWYATKPDGYAPYDRVKVIVFYPPPFYRESPCWGKHFIAYVRGATDVNELSDLGFDK